VLHVLTFRPLTRQIVKAAKGLTMIQALTFVGGQFGELKLSGPLT
jgi:hypothetical protein